jgi:hypothetical protein
VRRVDSLARPLAPSPQGGEGWGEGVRCLPILVNVFEAIGVEQDFAANGFDNAIDVFVNITVPETDYPKTETFNDFCARQISSDAVVGAMLPSIKFDDELDATGTKVGDVIANRFLSDKLCAFELATSQARPELAFDFGLIASQASRGTDQFALRHRLSPLTLTLSPSGRGNHIDFKSPLYAQTY